MPLSAAGSCPRQTPGASSSWYAGSTIPSRVLRCAGKKDLSKYGIKTFFASDVCSCYRRDAYLDCGGFDRVNTNEDMLMASRFVAAGCKVAYEPKAEVYHSHNLTPKEQYARNRAVGRFLEEHVERY